MQDFGLHNKIYNFKEANYKLFMNSKVVLAKACTTLSVELAHYVGVIWTPLWKILDMASQLVHYSFKCFGKSYLKSQSMWVFHTNTQWCSEATTSAPPSAKDLRSHKMRDKTVKTQHNARCTLWCEIVSIWCMFALRVGWHVRNLTSRKAFSIPRAIFDLNPILRTTSMCRRNVDSETQSLQWEQNK